MQHTHLFKDILFVSPSTPSKEMIIFKNKGTPSFLHGGNFFQEARLSKYMVKKTSLHLEESGIEEMVIDLHINIHTAQNKESPIVLRSFQ